MNSIDIKHFKQKKEGNDMIDRMNRSMVAETLEEKKMEALLNRARNSNMLKRYAENLKVQLKEFNPSFYSYRVKKVYSAIRSFRIAKYERVEQMHDLFGVLIVVDNEKEIKDIVKIIRDNLCKKREMFSEYNLLTEKDWVEQKIENSKSDNKETIKVSSKLNRIIANDENLERILPPLSYIITSYIQIENEKIPVEFRIQTKNAFHVIESFYFVIYKNDTLDSKIKAQLLNAIRQILIRKIRIDVDKNLNGEEEERLLTQIGYLYQYNFNLLCQNRDLLIEVWREYEKIAVKYKMKLPVYDFHFFGVNEKSKKEMDLIDEELDKIFENYKSFDIREIKTDEFVNDAEKNLDMQICVS